MNKDQNEVFLCYLCLPGVMVPYWILKKRQQVQILIVRKRYLTYSVDYVDS